MLIGRPLVSADELGRLLRDHSDLVVADVRWYLDGRSGRSAYEHGHIPGAVFVDLERDLAGPVTARTGRHPLPAPEAFAAAMEALGITDESSVVAYDDAGGSIAARLWWMLQATGRDAAVLDGGLHAWSGPLESGPGLPTGSTRAGSLSARPWPAELLADADLVGSGRVALVDARAAERYRGEVEPVDRRPGHIPGARNLPWTDNLAADGRFRAAAELRERFAGPAVGEDVVVYCGSGVTACHDLLALEVAGLGRGRLYPGSWSEWSADPDRPAVIGGEP